jgi:hypothetical protein
MGARGQQLRPSPRGRAGSHGHRRGSACGRARLVGPPRRGRRARGRRSDGPRQRDAHRCVRAGAGRGYPFRCRARRRRRTATTAPASGRYGAAGRRAPASLGDRPGAPGATSEAVDGRGARLPPAGSQAWSGSEAGALSGRRRRRDRRTTPPCLERLPRCWRGAPRARPSLRRRVGRELEQLGLGATARALGRAGVARSASSGGDQVGLDLLPVMPSAED